MQLLDAILDSWDRNNTILINLLRLVPAELMELRGTATSHTLGELFTHMHYCRLVFVFEDAPEIVPVEPKGEWSVEHDRDRLVQKLNESCAAVREAVRTRIASAPRDGPALRPSDPDAAALHLARGLSPRADQAAAEAERPGD